MFDSPIDEIKQKIDIVELIQEYISLRRAGANFKALCPFHQEKTPSFFVSPERQIWHCFGCGEGGDVFKFVMKMEGLEFGDALRFLAKKAGIELRYQDPRLQTKRAKLLEILDLASRFYHQSLLKSKLGEVARQYIKKRKIEELMIDQFRLGFAPDLQDELYKFLRKKGFKDNDILDSGLVIRKEFPILDINRGRLNIDFFDRFRNRLLFPIFDIYHNVIGFGGRILPGRGGREETKLAKYINTPQTLVYDKSRILYGLNFAKQEIRKQKKAVIVEGYMDVITSHQAGIKNVIAASGTALTLAQIQLLKRYTENIVLAFDMDLAGDSATKRGIDLAVSSGLNVKIAQIPKGKDPDEFIKSEGGKEWKKIIDSAISVIDYYFINTFKNFNLEKIEDKKKAVEILLSVIANFPSPIEQAHYLQKLAAKVSLPEESLRESFEVLKKKIRKYEKRKKQVSIEKIEVFTKDLSEDLILKQIFSLILHYPLLLETIKNEFNEEYLSDEFKILYKIFLEEYNRKKELNFREIEKKLSKIEISLVDLIAEIYLYYEQNPLSEEKVLEEFKNLVSRFYTFFYKKELQRIEKEMAKAEKEGNSEKIKFLNIEFNKILTKLSSFRK